MTRILKSETNKSQNSENLSSKLSVSKKSKIIKKTDKKAIEIKNQDNQQNEGWNISDVLSNIFSYTDHKDLVEFNTVCKRWNHLTNPIIHKTIKLDSKWDATWQRSYTKNKNAAKIDADVVECIANNAKHAHLVKEFKFNYKMNPQRAVKVFETFRFICNLTIKGCDMKQDQFLGMISPLTQLEELTLKYLNINNVIKKKSCKEAVQLPSSLKKLSLFRIGLTDNTELFVKTINSHNSLVEYSSISCSNNKFLEPFYKHYPSLLNFEFVNYNLEAHQLLAILEHNPQLINIKLSLSYLTTELIACLNSNFSNLEALKLSKIGGYYGDNMDFVKFSQPTKIKKLYISWGKLSNCSLDSILLSCPHLEELDLKIITCMQQNSIKSISFSNPIKLKKLSINCYELSEGVFESILLNCPNINELSIRLPFEWKETMKTICEKCSNLERLSIFPLFHNYLQESDIFYKEFYESEFITNSPKCKSTLTHLTLDRFKAHEAKAEYFKNFEKLKSIKYPNQHKNYHYGYPQEVEINMDLWPGYKIISKDNIHNNDVEFKKALI